MPASFMGAAARELGSQLTNEMHQSQIEVATPPLQTASEARIELCRLRAALAEVGRDFGVGIVAAGTHPLAFPAQQQPTQRARYARLINSLAMVGLGNLVCGLHVHVEVPEPDLRVQIMQQLVPFLPLLLAFSTSSPFWAGYNTGLLGYRNAANRALPRTGLPELFKNLEQYQAYVQTLADANVISDQTDIWWALRPSLRYPTLELRLTDSCTYVDDSIAIAGLFRALVHKVVKEPRLNADLSPVVKALTEENCWIAQRYGIDGTYIDVANSLPMSFSAWMEQTFELLSEERNIFDLDVQFAHLRRIVSRGTSSHLQLERYQRLLTSGLATRQALRQVSKWLMNCTESGALISDADRCRMAA